MDTPWIPQFSDMDYVKTQCGRCFWRKVCAIMIYVCNRNCSDDIVIGMFSLW